MMASVYPTIFLLVLLSWTAQQAVSSPMMTPGAGELTPSPRSRVSCKEKECSCEEIGCMYFDGALPKDCPSMVWTEKNFLAKFDECKKMMEKEGKDTAQFGEIKCWKKYVGNIKYNSLFCFQTKNYRFCFRVWQWWCFQHHLSTASLPFWVSWQIISMSVLSMTIQQLTVFRLFFFVPY